MKITHAGSVVLLGEPNAGKSTLTNAWVGEKVSIVSPKPQTTRQRANGLLVFETAQIMVIDPPGFIESRQGLNPLLLRELRSGLDEADVAAVCLSPFTSRETAEHLKEMAVSSGLPWIVLWLRDDQSTPESESLIEWARSWGAPLGLFRLSARRMTEAAEQHRAALGAIAKSLPETAEPLFDPEIYTTQSVRQLVAEAIREQCFLQLEQEVPYQLAILIRKFEESATTQRGREITKIYADIIIERESQRGIVIGQQGKKIKALGTAARKEIEKIVGNQVHLELHVTHRPGWSQDSRILQELGLHDGPGRR